MAGINLQGGDIQSKAGIIALQFLQVLEQVKLMQAFFTRMPDVTLEAPPFNILSGDVALLKSAFTNMDNVRQIFFGLATQGVAADNSSFTNQLAGLGF